MASTAQQLIAYRRELIAGGIDHDLANDLVKDAAQAMVLNEGLRITVRENRAKEDFVGEHTNPSLIGTTPTP
ncbi:hypothetical protein [Streptomyces hirsutus]|uniref:hypothetical protein n=1 Tax=Streptomyces hirsutus TaxID=35620 RepID=UPI00367E1270